MKRDELLVAALLGDLPWEAVADIQIASSTSATSSNQPSSISMRG